MSATDTQAGRKGSRPGGTGPEGRDPFAKAKAVGWLMVALSVLVLPAVWLILPDGQWPIHWDLQGNVNGYGGRTMSVGSLAIVPAIMIAMQVLLAWLPRLEGLRDDLSKKSPRAYSVTWSATMAFMLVVHLGTAWLMVHLAARSGAQMPIDLTETFLRLCCVAVGVLMMVLGNMFGKIRHNAVFGVRTPFTLTSLRAWDRTHRVGGRLFVAAGLLVTAVAFVNAVAATVLLLVLPLGLAVGLTVYSYLVWKNDPGRLSG